MANPNPDSFAGSNKLPGLEVKDLFDAVIAATNEAKTKLANIKANKNDVSIGEMFEMQMIMNKLSQLSELTSAMVAASHQAIQSMASKISR